MAAMMNDRSWSIYARLPVRELADGLRDVCREYLDPNDHDPESVDEYLATLTFEDALEGYVAAHCDVADEPYGGMHLAHALSRRVAVPVFYVARPVDEPSEVTALERGAEIAAGDFEARVLMKLDYSTITEPEPVRPAMTCVVEGASPERTREAIKALYGWQSIPESLSISSNEVGTLLAARGDEHRGVPEELSEVMPEVTIYEPYVNSAGSLLVYQMVEGGPVATWREAQHDVPLPPWTRAVDEIRGARSAREILIALGIDPARFNR